jgi:hypothetical protein
VARDGRMGYLSTRVDRRPVSVEPVREIPEELVVGDANDALGIDDDVLSAPAQSVVLARAHMLVTADDQHARIIDGSSPESGLHRGCLVQVLELAEPVDNLGVPMVEARAPLARRLVPVPDEQAARPASSNSTKVQARVTESAIARSHRKSPKRGNS